MKTLLTIFLFLNVLYADWTDDVSAQTKKAYDTTVEKGRFVYYRTLELFADENLTDEQARRKRFEKIWDDLIGEFEEGASLEAKLISAPDEAWFTADKSDVRESIDDKVNEIIDYLIHDDLLSYKTEVAQLKAEIDRQKRTILTYREKRIGAPVKSLVHTTKSGYTRKIAEAKERIRIAENEIRIIEDRLAANLQKAGIELDRSRVRTLLHRVDGDDFIRMSLAMDVLKQMTVQLLALMRESREEPDQARKYYAMHLVSMEVLVAIEQRYLDRIDRVYLVRLDEIRRRSEEMVRQTENALRAENDPGRKAIYRKNLDNQRLTLKVAGLYRQQLVQQRRKVLEAQRIAKKDLEVAQNTYNTVMLSAVLYDLMEESRQTFDRVVGIQLPVIVPFENLRMQEKYGELTERLGRE